MKPWPVELQKMFPRNDGMRPDRPWWSSYNGTMDRRDGCSFTAEQRVKYFTYTDTPPYTYDIVVVRTLLYELQAELDTMNPIPHPGFRVGQIWAIPLANNPRHYVVGSNECKLESGFRLTTLGDTTIEGDTGKVFFDWVSTEGNMTEESSLHLWLKGAFLVYDPVCPWLAPWSPAEIVK